MDVHDQQPPNSLLLCAIGQEILKAVSKKINSIVPIDFFLDKTALDALKSDAYPPSLLEGHENDPWDEKQSNFVKIFVYIIIYFNARAIIIMH